MSNPVMEGFSAASRRSLEERRGGVSLVVDGVEGPIELVCRGGGRTWLDAWWATLARCCGRGVLTRRRRRDQEVLVMVMAVVVAGCRQPAPAA